MTTGFFKYFSYISSVLTFHFNYLSINDLQNTDLISQKKVQARGKHIQLQDKNV